MGMVAKIGEKSLKDKGECPYQCNFATSKVWWRQSNAFDMSVKRAPKVLPVSIASLDFSIRTKDECCILYPFSNQH